MTSSEIETLQTELNETAIRKSLTYGIAAERTLEGRAEAALTVLLAERESLGASLRDEVTTRLDAESAHLSLRGEVEAVLEPFAAVAKIIPHGLADHACVRLEWVGSTGRRKHLAEVIVGSFHAAAALLQRLKDQTHG